MDNQRALIQEENDGTLYFGNCALPEKQKVEGFEHKGDLYKVKSFCDITKLERNGLFVYESVPGTNVSHFSANECTVAFRASGAVDTQITLGLEEDTDYNVTIDGKEIGRMKTNIGGKLSINVEFEGLKETEVKVTRA